LWREGAGEKEREKERKTALRQEEVNDDIPEMQYV
jgi:hypothetical protein